MKKYGNVKDYAALSVAFVVRGSDVIACDVVVIRDFAVVGDGSVKWALLTMANTAYYSIVMIYSMLTRKRGYFAVSLEMLDYFCLPLDKLVEKL